MILLLIPLYLLIKVTYRVNATTSNHKWEEDFNLDEPLDTYFESISGSDQKVMFATESYYRKKFGIKTISDDALEKLRTTKNKGFANIINTTPSYYIFDNQFYQDHLQYIPMNYRDEDIDYQISDPIAVAIFQSDNCRMENGARKGDVGIIGSDLSHAKEAAKAKAAKALKKLPKQVALRLQTQQINSKSQVLFMVFNSNHSNQAFRISRIKTKCRDSNKCN